MANLSASYEQLEKSEILLGILGYALAIGNIMNAGTPKGQSDGFEPSTLNKLASMKDNTGRSMLKYIIEKMSEKDPEMRDKLQALNKSINHKDISLKACEDKSRDIERLFNTTKASFTAVTKSGEPFDKF